MLYSIIFQLKVLGKQRRNGTIDDADNGTANRDFGSIGGEVD